MSATANKWLTTDAGIEGVPPGWTKRTLAKLGHEDSQEALERARDKWPELEVQLLGRQWRNRWIMKVRPRGKR